MKTINFELSKRLNDLGLLDEIETEYQIYKDGHISGIKGGVYGFGIKTLTLEEAIEFLPGEVNNYSLEIYKFKEYYEISYINKYSELLEFKTEKTLLEAIEKMIEYLLNNNLLGKKK